MDVSSESKYRSILVSTRVLRVTTFSLGTARTVNHPDAKATLAMKSLALDEWVSELASWCAVADRYRRSRS